jgi:putative oxidoreductase
MLRGANAGLGLLVLRVVIGFVFLWHGLGKLIGPPFAGGGMDGTITFFSTIGMPMATLTAWFAAILETLGGAALILGVAVPIAGLLLAIEMLVAIIKVKLGTGFSGPGGGFEFELTLLAGCVCLMLAGPGVMSVRLHSRE